MDLYGVIALVIGCFLGGWDLLCYFSPEWAEDKADMLQARAKSIRLYRQLRKKPAAKPPKRAVREALERSVNEVIK